MTKQKDTPRPQSEEDIDAFLRQVALINDCSYIKMRTAAEPHPIFKMHYKKGQDMEVTTMNLPERESVEAFLMRIRPIVVYEEELYIGKVATFVFEGKGAAAEKRLELYRRGLQRRKGNLFSIIIDGQEFTMQDFLWMHLYGKYFHLERAKRVILKKLEHSFGVLTEATALGNLEIYATIATFLAEDIQKMRAGKPLVETPNVSLIK